MSSVFLSYSHADATVADDIGAMLDDLDIQYFRDIKDIDVGDEITGSVTQALECCRALLVIVSPASLASQWVPYEIGNASGRSKKVLPYLTHPALEVPHYIRDLSYATTVEQLRDYFQTRFQIDLLSAADVTGVPSASGVYLMRSHDEIYRLAVKLVNGAKNHVYSTAFGTEKYRGTDEYIESLAKAGKRGVMHKAIFSNEVTADRNRSILSRRSAFEKLGAVNNVQFAVSSPWGVDFLIVDSRHVHLSYHQTGGQALHSGLEVFDVPEAVKEIGKWHDKCVWNDEGVDFEALQT